MVLANLSDC